MLRILRPNLWFLTFILLTGSGTITGQDDKPAAELQNVDKLVELLYSLEDFQVRFGNTLENDAVFKDHSDDSYFLKTLTESAKATAVNEYGESIGRAALKLTQGEVDSLIAALQSPYGDAIRKLFGLDNSEVERELAQYVNAIIGDAVASLRVRDGLLFEKEYPFDLKEVMSGSFIDSISPGRVVQVERTDTTQTETLNGAVYNFRVNWTSNSTYAMADMPGNPTSLGGNLPVNIYEIDNDRYKYIWKTPDGSYAKHELKRIAYASYEDELKSFRWSLHDKYASEQTSPLDTSEIERFKSSGGHQHFDVNKKFRLSARVVKEPNEDKTITLQTSDGREKTYNVYGTASFTLQGKELTLDLYQPVAREGGTAEQRLFLPFRDGSSGDKTYGGGRYIDLDVPTGENLIIDFNKSYNPYCAYTDGYSCPIPPEENTLEIAIEAGIKTPKLK
jgi:uncharacterized protein (DUF1684 family)